MPDDHSESVPPLPIPNRTVKRLRADDSAATSVKVGYRQALTLKRPRLNSRGRFALCRFKLRRKRLAVSVRRLTLNTQIATKARR